MTNEARRNVLLISGGKDSTALAIYMNDRHPEIEMEYLFTDTHKELPETYEFLTRLESYLGKPINRVANGLGDRGFDHWLTVYGDFLPSPQMRWCTRKLKIEPFEEFVGDDPTNLYVAIRADERRSGYVSTKENILPLFPFKVDGITKQDVYDILEESGVGLPDYYRWRTRSGCYFCFYQRKTEWVGLLNEHPDLYERAMEYEKPEAGYTWQQGESLLDIRQPERIEEILERDRIRSEQVRARRRPTSLAEAFGFIEAPEDDDPGCVICHL